MFLIPFNIHLVTIIWCSAPCNLKRPLTHSPQEIGLKPENLSPEGGAAVAQQLAQKLSTKAVVRPEKLGKSWENGDTMWGPQLMVINDC